MVVRYAELSLYLDELAREAVRRSFELRFRSGAHISNEIENHRDASPKIGKEIRWQARSPA